MSTYTGRYQSRFFNFVAERSLRLGNATAKAARHIRLAAETAVQAVLYPVYAVFQTVHRLDRQVKASRQSQHPLPQADGPIEEILEEIQHLNLSPQPIRGLASSCTGGHLVLITPDNHVLDLLTRDQQDHLDQVLVQAIAGYWHQTLKAVRPSPKPYPVRVFRRAMRWVQQSPLARSLNWFREADLVQQASSRPQLPEPEQTCQSSALSPQAIALLDRQIAYLETEYLLPIVEEPEPVWVKIRLIVKAAIDYFFGSTDPATDPDSQTRPRLTSNQTSNSSRPLTGTQHRQLSASGGSIETRPDTAAITSDPSSLYHRIQELIEGAVAYFFGLDRPTPPNRTPNPSSLPDPWDTPELATKYPFQVIAAATAAIPLPESVSFNNPFGEFPQPSKTPIHSQPPGQLTNPNHPQSETQIEPSHTAMTHSQAPESSGEIATAAPYSQNEWQPDFKPEWIEAYVNDVHYVRHPLETILHWLDGILLKLETWVIQLWKRLFH